MLSIGIFSSKTASLFSRYQPVRMHMVYCLGIVLVIQHKMNVTDMEIIKV